MKTKTQTSSVCPQGTPIGLGLGRVLRMFLAAVLLSACGITMSARADRVDHDVAAAYIKVEEYISGYFDNSNAVAYPLISVNGMQVVTNLPTVPNMGDTRLSVGDIAEDDVTNGVLIVSIAQNGRANWTNTSGVKTNNYQTAAAIPYAAGYWEAGVFRCPPITSTSANPGEDNVNFSAAYFPFSTWVGGYAVNGANGLELTNLVASPGLVLGTHFKDYLTNSVVSDAVANGVYYLDLRSFGIDSRRDGVLLVNHAKNEANYALSRINNDDDEMDGTWTIYTHDNRANGRSYEQDPVSFVFVPKTDTSVISGMFMGDGAISMYSGLAPEFTITWRTDLGNGTYELKIPGHSPADGVLLISNAGGDANNGDNIVTFQPNTAGDGWLIQSRDLPGCGLQSPPDTEPVCSFVFIPAEQPGITVTPSENLKTTEAGGTVQFNVIVNGYPKPTANVAVNLSSGDTTEGTVSPLSLTFTPAEWGVGKQVTLTGVNDAIADGTQPYQINLSNTSSTDPNFNGLVADTVYAINLDDEAGVALDASRVTTTEDGGTNTFNVWLTGTPTDTVTINLSSSDTTEATVSPATLIFTTSDFATPQTVTVTGVDDFVQDGPVTYFVVTAAAVSSDPAYNGFNAINVDGENIDNDVAKVIIPADKQTVTEPNGTTSFPVVLATQPTANVTVNFVSGDTSEATVTPSVTFTTGNWNTPQNVTITAVDDLVNDGTVAYTITSTLSSSDPVYAVLNPDDVSAETVDNEADLVLPSGDLTYGIGDVATGIDGYATVADSTADYNTGSLTVSLVTAAASDRLDVRNAGTGTGQIGVSGSTVSYEGVAIGTKSGGTGTTPLTVSLNAASTPVAAQALIRAVTYQNIDANLAPQTKTATVTLADGDGGVSTASKAIIIRLLRVYSFQQDADGGFGAWTGANDCQISWEQPSTTFPQGIGSGNTTLWIDWNTGDLNGFDQSQALLRFTNIFGTGPGQIPPGAKIVSAELIMNVTDSGHGALFNRMLIDWDSEGTTYSGFAAGNAIQLDNAEAESGTNSFFMDLANNTTSGGGKHKIGVTADVQAWQSGAANYGWVMSPKIDGANGTAFSPCEHTNVTLRPRLKVAWLPASVSTVSFRQGESSYASAADTQVRLTAPTTSFAANGTLSPDWLVSATPIPNQNQVLLKFDNIIGSGVGQIPAGSTILAAVLDLTSINADAQGAGGQFHAALKAWTDADTWDIWVNGISTDGIEAAVTATETLPVEGYGTTVQPTRYAVELTSDVQAWASGTVANNGWAIMPWPNGNNGWAFNSSEATLLDTRPRLRVYFEPGVVIMAPVHNGSNVQITFSGVNGRTYTVQRRGNLTTGSWSNIGTASVSGGTATFQDNAPLPGSAFYRVVYP